MYITKPKNYLPQAECKALGDLKNNTEISIRKVDKKNEGQIQLDNMKKYRHLDLAETIVEEKSN